MVTNICGSSWPAVTGQFFLFDNGLAKLNRYCLNIQYLVSVHRSVMGVGFKLGTSRVGSAGSAGSAGVASSCSIGGLAKDCR